jgi:superfamily II DNA/RNA helicase
LQKDSSISGTTTTTTTTTKQSGGNTDHPMLSLCVSVIPENEGLSLENAVFLSDAMRATLSDAGYSSLFPVQVKAYVLQRNYCWLLLSVVHQQPIPYYYCLVSFPIIFAGRDALVKARTGTGKTLGFSIPIIQRLSADAPYVSHSLSLSLCLSVSLSIMVGWSCWLVDSDLLCTSATGRGRAPRVLVMAPTRELAMQVGSEMKKISGSLSVLCIYGQTPYGPQGTVFVVVLMVVANQTRICIESSVQLLITNVVSCYGVVTTEESAFRSGVDIVVGTPGRIIDHINRGTLKLTSIKFIVLDEADEMLSIGFLKDMEEVLSAVPKYVELMETGDFGSVIQCTDTHTHTHNYFAWLV